MRNWELLAHGPATNTDDRRSLVRAPHDRKKRLEAKKSLRHDPVEFTGEQALCVANGFARAIRESGYVLLACSIMPRHFHVVVVRHTRLAERIAGHLKARATQELVAREMHPFVRYRGQDGRFPSVWTHRSWKVYLNSYPDIERWVKYVEDNPLKERKPRQHWSFVTQWKRPASAPMLVDPSLADPLAGRFPRRS